VDFLFWGGSVFATFSLPVGYRTERGPTLLVVIYSSFFFSCLFFLNNQLLLFFPSFFLHFTYDLFGRFHRVFFPFYTPAFDRPLILSSSSSQGQVKIGVPFFSFFSWEAWYLQQTLFSQKAPPPTPVLGKKRMSFCKTTGDVPLPPPLFFFSFFPVRVDRSGPFSGGF